LTSFFRKEEQEVERALERVELDRVGVGGALEFFVLHH